MRYHTLVMATLGLLSLVVCWGVAFSSQAADETSGNRGNSESNQTPSEQQISRISDEPDTLLQENAVGPFSVKRSRWSKRIFGRSYQRHGWWHSNDIDFPPWVTAFLKLSNYIVRPLDPCVC